MRNSCAALSSSLCWTSLLPMWHGWACSPDTASGYLLVGGYMISLSGNTIATIFHSETSSEYDENEFIYITPVF